MNSYIFFSNNLAYSYGCRVRNGPPKQGENVAVVGNHTSVLQADIVNNPTHLVDTLISHGVNVVKAFAPEHGFRGNQANGAHIVDGVDTTTGLEILSLHGKNKKP